MYHSWNFFLLIPYHVERLFIALLEAIPHQLLASSSREESVFQTLPCGGCVGARLLFPAVLKYSFRARSQETHRSRTADLMLEFRGLEEAMMKFAWDNYKSYAWGKNELRPLTKNGHIGNMFAALIASGSVAVLVFRAAGHYCSLQIEPEVSGVTGYSNTAVIE
ncbi:hypothetical protein PO909_008829 [Leuciscus waleckii]